MTEPQDVGFKAGEIVGERYRVVAQLGSGGMGTVYRVEHTLMAKEMAMKLLRPELSVIPQIVERFEREARSASRLDNEHIVRVMDFGRAPNGALYLVMELLEGESLTDRMKAAVSLPASEALEIADQVLAALEHAHGNGIVHRDLKPDNMMLVRRDSRVIVKILDFGLAKMTSESAPDQPTLTQAGMVFGTPRYMAPEQAAAEPVDERTDLYAVGVLLYEMLSGKPPFMAPNAVDLLTAHLTQPVPPLEAPNLPQEVVAKFQAVIHRAMQKHRRDRYDNASSFRAALAELRPMLPESAYVDTKISIPGTARVLAAETKIADTVMKRGPSAISQAPQPAPKRLPYIAGAIAAMVIFAGGIFLFGGEREQTSAHERAEQAIAAGELASARAILGQLIAKDAKDARTEVLLGHINVAEGDHRAAAEAYKRALELDGSSMRDPVMMANARRIIDKDQKTGALLVTALALHADATALELFVELAQKAPTQKMRNHAFQALERLRETSRLDLPAYLGDELEKISAKSCKTRKWYVDRLAQLDDPRVLPVLKREKQRKGGILGLEDVNRCMADELKAHIERLEKN